MLELWLEPAFHLNSLSSSGKMNKAFLSPSSWSCELLINQGSKEVGLAADWSQVLLKSELCQLELHLFDRNLLKSLPLSAPLLGKKISVLIH